MKIAAIIPARFGSTRFHGKPLAVIDGKPMIRHVYENTKRCDLLDRVIVATDHKKVFDIVAEFGGEAFITSPAHPSGTDRLVEVAARIDADIIVNVQGDEPLIEPDMLKSGLEPFFEDERLKVSTLAYKIKDEGDIFSPDVVKVVFNGSGYALYFSRSPVPYLRKKGVLPYYKHLGVYFYRKDFLLEFSRWEPAPLELAEGLEQLRMLEHGVKIKVLITERDTVGVDTPADIARVEEIMRSKRLGVV